MEINNIKNKLSPKFFFVSLGVIISLIVSVASFLVLLFESLNKKFPDVLNSVYQYGYNSYEYESIRTSLATLIIFFPIFFIISRLWNRESKKEISGHDLTLRKWMIYLILFLASLLIAIDLIALVNYFVSGEITIRFIFKVLGALVVGSLVNFYYFSVLKIEDLSLPRIKKINILYYIISFSLVFGLIVFGFLIMGSPSKQRAWRLDERRMGDLQSIQWQIINYWQQKERLPVSLSDLSDPISSFYLPKDPEFEKGKNYEYFVKSEVSFELCATFSEEIQKEWQENYNNTFISQPDTTSPSFIGGVSEVWDHGRGRTCFSRTIDKEIYPSFKK